MPQEVKRQSSGRAESGIFLPLSETILRRVRWVVREWVVRDERAVKRSGGPA